MAKKKVSPKKSSDGATEVAIVFAGIRWLVNEIEQVALSKYMSNRKNDTQVIRKLRATIAALGGISNRKPVGVAPDECDYPWERCRDDSCRMDCSGIGRGNEF